MVYQKKNLLIDWATVINKINNHIYYNNIEIIEKMKKMFKDVKIKIDFVSFNRMILFFDGKVVKMLIINNIEYKEFDKFVDFDPFEGIVDGKKERVKCYI